MLDDLHRLTSKQRKFLLDEIITSRFPVGIWLAERLEALEIEELLSSGALIGRDYGKVISLEDYWRGAGGKRFENLVTNISDRRAKDAKDVEIYSFAGCLQESLDGLEWEEEFRQGAIVVSERTQIKAGKRQIYSEWLAELEKTEGTPREVAIAWRTLEILIEREERKKQKTLDFPKDAKELERLDDSAVRASAELFLCKEFKIPYYFGIHRLTSLASSNIQQFLWLAGNLFEEAASSALLKKSSYLTPTRQEQILKHTIRENWNAIRERILRWIRFSWTRDWEIISDPGGPKSVKGCG